MKKCPHCDRIYNNNDFYCLNDNYRLVVYTDEQMEQDQKRRLQPSNIPKCPTCNSHNVKKITNTSKVVYGALFGLFSKTARSQFKCNNCGYMW